MAATLFGWLIILGGLAALPFYLLYLVAKLFIILVDWAQDAKILRDWAEDIEAVLLREHPELADDS